jgi:hypothetical protein
MIEQIRTLIRFYEQKLHVPITLITNTHGFAFLAGMKSGLQFT